MIAPTDPLTPEETVIRHIPAGTLFVKPPPKGPAITSANFRLREGEDYISLGRLALHSIDDIVDLSGGDRKNGSQAAWCAVYRLTDASFRLEPKPLPHYPGHAGLFGSDEWPLSEKRTQQFLASLFRFEPVEDDSSKTTS